MQGLIDRIKSMQTNETMVQMFWFFFSTEQKNKNSRTIDRTNKKIFKLSKTVEQTK